MADSTRRAFMARSLAAASAGFALVEGATAQPTTLAADRRAEFAGRAARTLDFIDQHYLLRDSGLYALRAGGRRPGFNWDQGVQLSALAGAARVDKGRVDAMRRHVKALDAYWHADANGLFGYDASPNNKGLDRYYDDNDWVALALVEAFEVTADRRYLGRAAETLKFILSGRDDTLGGGIFWHEQERKSKNTCANAPAVAAMLRVAVHEPARAADLRRGALEIYRWTNDTLRDPADGLMWDNVTRDGTVNRKKWTYNTALMIRAALLLAATAADAAPFLEDARRFAGAAVAHWADPQTGAIRDAARFAHLLNDALVEMTDATGEPRWRQTAEAAADFAWNHTRDADGYFGERWDKPPADDDKRELINQASMARACARLAWPARA